MEFNIGIQTKPDGELIIEDTSKDYDQYLQEGVESTSSYEYYKYFKSVTINSLYKVNVDNKVHIKDDINLHQEDIDTCQFILQDDGYYVDYHIVLPTIDWYNEITPEYKEYFSAIYIYNEGKIYKEIDSELQETSIEEIIERNVEGTTIIRCKLDIFFTGNLQKCYIGYSQKIFKD